MGLAWQPQSPQRRWLLIQEPAVPDCDDRSQAKVRVSKRLNSWQVP